MAAALDGIRVIDLTVWFQGPVAAQHLADFGAEVIKVERPQGGDQGRGVRSIKALPVGDWNQYFLVINRNKKSLALDLKKPAGRDIMYRLVEKSDVFLSNMGVELLESWDLGYEKLSRINPRLVYATNTGYGRFGQVSKPSFDMTVQALTGLMARLGEPDQPPIYLGMGSGDAYGGLHVGARHRARLCITATAPAKGSCSTRRSTARNCCSRRRRLQPYLATGDMRHATQQSRKAAPNPLWNVYRAKDKWVFLCVPNTDENWTRLAATLDDGALAGDARFDSVEHRAPQRETTRRAPRQGGQTAARRRVDGALAAARIRREPGAEPRRPRRRPAGVGQRLLRRNLLRGSAAPGEGPRPAGRTQQDPRYGEDASAPSSARTPSCCSPTSWDTRGTRSACSRNRA